MSRVRRATNVAFIVLRIEYQRRSRRALVAGAKKVSTRCVVVIGEWLLFSFSQLHLNLLFTSLLYRVRDFPNLAEDRRQMAVASRMSTNMKNGMLYQSHTVAHKSESALLCILSPEQTVKYLEWFKANRERCERVLKKRQVKVINKEESSFSSDGKENSLKEICEKLDAVLRIQESITKPAAPPYS